MNAPYPTARVIALYTLLTPMLFGFGVGLPLGVLMLPVVLASLLCGFLPALACGIWLAVWRTRGTRGGRPATNCPSCRASAYGARAARAGGGCTRWFCARRRQWGRCCGWINRWRNRIGWFGWRCGAGRRR